MWKKLGVLMIALVVSLTVGYAFYNFEMRANGYSSRGEVTGRVGAAGNGEFSKGDRIITDIAYQGKPIDWLLLNDSSQWLKGGVYTVPSEVDGTSNGMLALSFEEVTNVSFRNSVGSGEFPAQLSTSNLIPIYTDINTLIDSNPLQKKYVLEHKIDAVYYNYAHQIVNNDYVNLENLDGGISIKYTFPITYVEIGSGVNGFAPTFGALNDDDRSFSKSYIAGTMNTDGSKVDVGHYITSEGKFAAFSMDSSSISWFTPMPLRIPILFNLTDVVFAVSDSYGSGYNQLLTVENIDQDSSSSSIYHKASLYHPMKIRLEDNANLGVSFDGITAEGEIVGTDLSQVCQGKKVELHWSGKLSPTGNDYVSLLVEKKNSVGKYDFIYYGNISQDIAGSYVLDTTGWDVGNYKISLVDETLPISSNVTYSSSLQTKALDVLEYQPHTIQYQKSVVGGHDKDYEFGRNVNQGDVIGKINLTTTPTTELPITYQIENNGDDTYKNFEIDGLDNNNSSSANSLDVKIKANAPDLHGNSLKAGDYTFCIVAQDADGMPSSPIKNKTKVCTTFVVEKKDVSVAFDDPAQTKKSIAQATTDWSETASANPSTGTKVTYAKSGGSVGLINIDPNTGAITYTGSGAYGKVTIKATADDDPTSGYDDYNSADTTKEIVIYREVDGSVTPHANSSDTTIPTFQTSDANIKPNGIIGTIKGTLGTPDNGTSGSTTYTYGLKNVDDDNYFSVNPSTGEIKTTADLSATTGSYNITVTVSDKWSTKEIPVMISVGLAPAENLKFYENSTSNTVINQKNVNFTDTNVSVFATVKGSTNNNPVTYKIQDGSTNVIEVNPNSGAITIKGVGTTIIVAEKAGASGQADAQTTLTFTVKAVSQNFIYTTDSTLQTEMPKNGNNYKTYTETYAQGKTFQLYTTGYPSGSSVTYQLKAGSPTDVISVDSDGTIHVLNASLNTQIGKVMVQATSHDPSGNYVDKTIELPITIEKGTRTIAFEDDPIYVLNGTGRVTPNILTDGVLDTDGTAMIEIDPSEDNSIAWTNDGETIQYSWSEATGKDIQIHVTKPADRNYKEAKADGMLHILGADEASLTITTPGKITYGDHFTVRSTQDDSMSTNVQYAFESDNQVFISTPQVNGNKAEFDAIGNSGSTEITIKVTRTADGELPLSKTVKIKVLPKPITIRIDDKEKKRLEDNPTLTFKDISNELVSWNGVKDNVDTSVIKLSTAAVKYSPIGSYPITSKNYTTLNDNYPNYIFTLKEGLLNVIDNGNKDFWDIDDDGCPDLNIQIKDEEGNVITINGDRNEDGIPDYNIDSNGDGKPDLNIDTDNDGKPDLNLVILKEWKPTKCVILDDIQYSSGITAKAEINIDTDGDFIPDINIDTKGDFKPHLNISKDGKTPSVNIATMESWKPDQDYKYQGFAYDTIHHKPYLNIDTDGDGRPDVNVDLDGDGSADINVDVDGDWIPDVDIDSTGDGKPDINVDTDGDGRADENLMDITEWKPEHNVNNPFEYDTMKIENKKELEDNGVTVEKPDGGSFLSNMAIKVTDVTNEKREEVKNKVSDLMDEQQEVKQVFEIKLLENGKEVQPEGILKIRIPIKDGVRNPILFRQKEDGSFEKINATIENGYLVYESDTLGIVSMIADKEEEPSQDIQGSYYPGENTGGALTGDRTNLMLHVSVICLSTAILCYLKFKGKKITAR